MEKDNEFSINKHWFVYIMPAFILIISVSLLNSDTQFWFILGIIGIAYSIYNILYYMSVKWILNSSGLQIKGGILPWKKMNFYIPIIDIYESYSSKGGPIGYFLGYSSITIRRTEGTTSAFSENYLVGVENFSGRINQLVQNYKKNKYTVNQLVLNNNVPNVSNNISEELRKLLELRNNGELSAQEFDTLKQRLIGLS